MSFGDEMAPPPAPIPWIISGTPEQLSAWRAAAERAGFSDPLHWIRRVLDAAALPAQAPPLRLVGADRGRCDEARGLTANPEG